MANREVDRRIEWKPAPRPEWVQRLNDEGKCMNIRGVVPLDEESLLSAAMRTTGLSDFGADDWREPFRVLIKSFEEDAALNLMGRIRTRSELLQLLEQRLQIEDWYKRHPEIDEEVIEKPIIIIGQGRSGTSMLINVLAQDPDNGATLHWEAMFPCPPPEKETYHSNPQAALGHLAIDQWNRVTPELLSMHEFAGHVPMEDCQLMGLSFRSPSWFTSLGQAASYDLWMRSQSYLPALEYHKKALKLLQWRNPRKRWILKDPMHIDRIEQVLKVYPDACLVWPHRDPVKALASTVSLLGTIQWGRSDEPFRGVASSNFLDPELAAARLETMIDKLESGVVPKERVFNLRYLDLVTDPVETARRIYRYFNIEFTPFAEKAMAYYMEQNPREARPAHKVQSVGDATLSRERAAFKRYQDYFDVPSE